MGNTVKKKLTRKNSPKTVKRLVTPATEAGKKIKKDVSKLFGRFNTDFLIAETSEKTVTAKKLFIAAAEPQNNPALKRLEALGKRTEMKMMPSAAAPVDPATMNWVPMGPLAVPNGQTYGGARVLISGRVTAIVTHPTDPSILYVGAARGGVWKSIDGGDNWTALSDNEASLAIGAMGISRSNPNVIYAGTGEGNLQLYSTNYPLDSAPGVYLGIGVLSSTNGGSSWILNGSTLFANHSFYRIAVDPTNEQVAFAATSKGLCRTMNGSLWQELSGNGLPVIGLSVIACTDVLIDSADVSGNTVYTAFWRSGIYKSTNARSANPTWTQLTTGLPAGNLTSRISLAQSPSMPQKIFALIADSGDNFGGIYMTTDATGSNWSLIISSGVSLYGAYTSNIAVDPITPNVLYVSGVELYKCVLNAGVWSVTNIGGQIHPDSHAFAFHPTNNMIIYSGSDGGIFKSANAGGTWDDRLNEGLNLLQYEAFDQHPTADSFTFGGTQDNGSTAYRNSPVFYHAADGDGGYCNISPVNPVNTIQSYYGVSFNRSILGGKFGTFSNISAGVNGSGLFYPPSAISPTSERMAIGTTVVNIDDNQGTGGWPGTGVSLPGLTTDRISSLSFANNTIIYAGTTSGKVYRVELTGATWVARLISAAPLPEAWVWDVSALAGNPNVVIAVLSGFGFNHVWKGTVPATGLATWTDISGTGVNKVPDIPVYAIAFKTASEFYVGTDIGIFRTVDGGTNWNNFSQGLPNTAIYDLRYHPTGLLRAATHGRGLWEIKTDLTAVTTDLYFRDNVMHSGRSNSNNSIISAFEDPLNYVGLGDLLYWWQCADIKVDSPNPSFQLTPGINYFDFETRLEHRNPEKGNTNRVYVQVHNRGPLPAQNVWVKIMFANASAGLPPLPADFWTSFPNSAGDANWTPVGAPKMIPLLNPLRPEVLDWTWKPPASANTHTCMLVVMDSASNPIPAANKVFDIGTLVTNEKRVGLKNLHVVNLLPDEPAIIDFHFYGKARQKFNFRVLKNKVPKNLSVEIVLPKGLLKELNKRKDMKGFTVQVKKADFAKKVVGHFKEKEYRNNDFLKELESQFDLTNTIRIDWKDKDALVQSLELNKGGLRILIVTSSVAIEKEGFSFSIVQENTEKQITGGSTFVIRTARRSIN